MGLGLFGALLGFALGGPLGAVIGGLIGGLIGVTDADFYKRFVDYDPREWPVLRFWQE